MEAHAHLTSLGKTETPNEVVDVKAHLTSSTKKKMVDDVPPDRRESSSQREFEVYLETVCKWHAWAVGAGDG